LKRKKAKKKEEENEKNIQLLKELYKGFKLKFYIEKGNGFHSLFRSIVKQSSDWFENIENDYIFCN